MIITEPLSNEKQEQTSIQQNLPIKFSAVTAQLAEYLKTEGQSEEKLKKAIDFMKEAIAQQGVPRFKDFWDAKGLCLPLFKEKLPQPIKEIYWKQYIELAAEAKRLKDLLDEQSSYACEQIDLAVKALCKEVDLELEKHKSINHSDVYQMQQEISVWVILTARLKALREEVAKTEMRIRHKNRLFKEISALGDLFIPRKNVLIKSLSNLFALQVKEFCESYFDFEKKEVKDKEIKLFDLKAKIKHFQEIAKKLSLQASVFSTSRALLTQSWDILKQAEVERKQLFDERKQQEALHIQSTKQAIEDEFSCELSSEIAIGEAKQKMYSLIEGLPLRFNEKKELKAILFEKVEAKLEPFKEIQKQKERELAIKQEEKKLKVSNWQEKAKELSMPFSSLEQIEEHLVDFKTLLEEKILDIKQMQECEELLRLLNETSLIKKEEMGVKTQELYALWSELKEKTKERVEFFRKQASLSGFDFEKAILFKEAVELEKARFERCCKKLDELEDSLD